MNPTSRNTLSPRASLSWIASFASLILLWNCGGDEVVSGDDDDGAATPTPSDGVEIAFNLEEGQAVSQTVALEVTGGAATSMAFLAPEELVGVDLDADPAVLMAQWDTTTEVNGEVTITVQADGPGGSVTESITVYRSNISAAIKGVYTANRNLIDPDYLEDGDYVRNGASLLLSFTASPFGSTPTLSRIEIREVTGGGLNPAVPIRGTQNGDWWEFNLGAPSEGTIHLLVSAVNSLEEYSEPLTLDLVALRDDIISPFVPHDFEVSLDGRTGLLLTANPVNSSDMRLEFINLSDPANPTSAGKLITLNNADQSTSGNVVMSPVSDDAYVVFPSSTSVYRIDVAAQSGQQYSGFATVFAPNPGNGLAHVNRSPFAQIDPDGTYLYGMVLAGAQLIMIATETMSLQEITNYPSATLGPMAVHPSGQYVYLVNNWGDTQSVVGKIYVFDVETANFVDNVPGTGGVQGVTVQSPGSEYLVGQQPLVTPDGNYLVTTWCKNPDASSSPGETSLTLLSLVSDGGASTNPYILGESLLMTGSGTAQEWGVPVAVGPDGRYLLVADGQPGLGGGVIVDLTSASVLSDIVFPSGVADGVFLSSTRLLASSSDWVDRDLTFVDLSAMTVEQIAVPGLTGLQPPGDADDMRNNILVRSGNYVYFVAPARFADTTGNTTTLGTTLSVYDIERGAFIFPNPVGQ